MNLPNYELETVSVARLSLSLVLVFLLTSLFILFPGENEVNSDTTLRKVKVFFPNSKLSSEPVDCKEVFPVRRWIDSTTYPPMGAMRELLKGPTAEEKKNGFGTSINSGVALRGLWIEDGLAKVDFSGRIEEGGGTCWVKSILSQIRTTLEQFDNVEKVKIHVGGRSERILQP